MASDIERMLEINNIIEGGDKSIPLNKTHKKANQQVLDKLVEDFDRQVYGPVQEPILKQGEKKPYRAEDEMKMLKEIDANGGRKKVNLEGRNIPQGIVESILSNPLDLKPIDPKMDELENRLKGNMPGIKAAANILERVDKQEQEAKEKLREEIIPHKSVSSTINYDYIRQIVEECIDNKLQLLNESIIHQQLNVPSMKLMNFKDKWLFVDNNDNVFECEMKYKGKKKKKR